MIDFRQLFVGNDRAGGQSNRKCERSHDSAVDHSAIEIKEASINWSDSIRDNYLLCRRARQCNGELGDCPGFGPIPVEVARQLSQDAFL